jgi:predicted TIM-barrel fold metal-dependent hydrolase
MAGVMISSDSHVVEPGDLWLERLPAALRDRAPRAIQDPHNHHWYLGGPGLPRGVDLTLSRTAGLVNAEVDATLAADPGAWIGAKGGHDPVERLRDQWRDGVVADVLYPTAGLSLLTYDDPELQLACIRAYNQWLAEFCAVDGDRLLGLAMIPTWDIADGVHELEQAHAAGLRGGIIWTSPPDSREHSFFSDHYEPLWAAAATLSMPLSVHILAGHRAKGMENWNKTVEGTFYFGFSSRDEVQRSLLELIAAAVFERHPQLQIVAAEAGIEFVARLEERADSTYTRFIAKMDSGMRMKPSEYFRRNVWCTYISDPIGLNNLRFTGAERFMWSNDYPHGAATWPNSRKVVESECAEFGVDDETIRKLTVTNVARLYGIDLAVVAEPSPMIATDPTLQEVTAP